MQDMYEAYHSQSDHWYPARIIAIRLAHQLYQSQSRARTAESYEYYVHYQPLDRRNDEWLNCKLLRKVECPPEAHLGQLEGQEAAEHGGMKKEEVEAHQRVTPIRLI